MNAVNYKELKLSEIDEALFTGFDRYQEVTRCWRKEKGEWILKDIPFIEQWNPEEYNRLITHLQNTIKAGGAVFGAFLDDVLIGFTSVENDLLGSHKEYLQLSELHISNGYRGLGIGKKLFSLICGQAKEMGAGKLYISAHSSQETQAFYQAMGCVEAAEYNDSLVAKEPYDCQLEYSLY